MVAVFREVRRVLRDDGTCWINLGDSYYSTTATQGRNESRSTITTLSGHGADGRSPALDTQSSTTFRRSAGSLKPKDLLMMPARLALALQADGWWLRSDIIWAKPNPMPESVTDRPTNAHEHVFLLTKRSRYFYDSEAVREEAIYGYKYGATAFTSGTANGDGHRGGQSGPATRNPETGRNLRNVWTIATAPFSEWTPQHEIVQLPASEAQAPGAKGNARGGDTARITSPDCPLHAGQPDRVPMGFYDGLSDVQLSRINGTADPAQDMPPGSSTTQHIPAHSRSHLSIGDCSDLEGAEIATTHSTESHKTGLGPLFSGHAISSEETASDRPRTAPLRSAPALTFQSTEGSKTEADSSDERAPQTGADSVHKSGSCCCGYYRKVTTKTSHFATFPPELAERCIRAGTSERGCCAQCGKPWVRQVEKPKPPREAYSGRSAPGDPRVNRGVNVDGERLGMGSKLQKWLDANPATTTGWSPGCQCNGHFEERDAAPDWISDETGERKKVRVSVPDGDAPPPVPCTVLDPFSGAGTALLVADRLGRDAIGIDLSHAYVEMARARLQADCPLFADIEPSPPPAGEDAYDRDMQDLFAWAAD